MLDAARLKSFHTSLTMYVHGVLFLWRGLAPRGARWAMVVHQLFASQITCACITMNVCHIVQYSNQGYIPVYSVPCDPLHRQGTFWWLCLQLLDNGSLVSAVDTVKADVVSFHKNNLYIQLADILVPDQRHTVKHGGTLRNGINVVLIC